MSRVLLRLRKGDQVEYISHRDMIRAFEFAVRRARIPVAYSAGFNPRQRMSFGSAAAVGVTSDDEKIVMELAAPEELSEMVERLNSQLPPGIEVLSAEVVPDGTKSPLSELNASLFRIALMCDEGCDPAEVRAAIEKLLSSDEIRVSRRREDRVEEVDIRPHIIDVRVAHTDSKDRSIVVEVSLKSADSGGARPQDFVQAIRNLLPGIGVARIKRLRQFRHPSCVVRRASSVLGHESTANGRRTTDDE